MVGNEGPAAATVASQHDRCYAGGQRCSGSWAAQVQPTASHPLMRLKDGGDVVSDADWSKPRAADSLGELRQTLPACIAKWNLVERNTLWARGENRC